MENLKKEQAVFQPVVVLDDGGSELLSHDEIVVLINKVVAGFNNKMINTQEIEELLKNLPYQGALLEATDKNLMNKLFEILLFYSTSKLFNFKMRREIQRLIAARHDNWTEFRLYKVPLKPESLSSAASACSSESKNMHSGIAFLEVVELLENVTNTDVKKVNAASLEKLKFGMEHFFDQLIKLHERLIYNLYGSHNKALYVEALPMEYAKKWRALGMIIERGIEQNMDMKTKFKAIQDLLIVVLSELDIKKDISIKRLEELAIKLDLHGEAMMEKNKHLFGAAKKRLLEAVASPAISNFFKPMINEILEALESPRKPKKLQNNASVKAPTIQRTIRNDHFTVNRNSTSNPPLRNLSAARSQDLDFDNSNNNNDNADSKGSCLFKLVQSFLTKILPVGGVVSDIPDDVLKDWRELSEKIGEINRHDMFFLSSKLHETFSNLKLQ